MKDWLIQRYLQIDPRTLALLRVGLALLLLFDLGKRLPELAIWYDNDGLLPNHTGLWAPYRRWNLSFFFAFSFWEEAAVACAVCALIYVGLLVGYRTKLMQVLSLVALYGLQGRVDQLANGGDFVLCILSWWLLFLPLGKRFSVDALRASMRARVEHRDTDLAQRPEPYRSPVTSLAVLALSLQLAVIYYFNTVHKSGPTWLGGQAVHYVLHQERIATFLGVWARSALPFSITQLLTWGTLVMEGALPLLILSPWGRPWTRRMAIVLVWALHGGIQLMGNFGLFSPVMMLVALHLVSPEDWEWLRARGKRGAKLVVYFDGSCGVCFWLARVLARMDVYGRLELRSNHRTEDLPEGLTAEHLQHTLAVVDPASGRWWDRSHAVAKCLAALPLGKVLASVLVLTRPLSGRAYDAFAQRRTRVSAFFGMATCGLPQPKAAAAPTLSASPSAPYRELWDRWRPRLLTAGVAASLVVALAQVLVENPSVPASMRPNLPRFMQAAVSYTRLQQGWRMFAPHAPTGESTVVVDALTASGRRVDPLNEVASPHTANPTLRRVPVYPNYNVYWVDYLARIEGMGSHHGALRDWILRYPQRTGNPQDRIVGFKVLTVHQGSPAPGESEPKVMEPRVFLSWGQDPASNSAPVASPAP